MTTTLTVVKEQKAASHAMLLNSYLGLNDPFFWRPLLTTLTLQEKLPKLFNRLTTPKNGPYPLALGDLDPFNTWFLGPIRVSPQTASGSI